MIANKLKITIENDTIKSISDSDTTSITINEIENKYDGYILPGIVDSHAHIIGLGESLNTIRLENAKSKKQALDMISSIKVEDGWISGRGWNEELWEDKEPCKEDLDNINSEIPIFLVRVDGHAAWVNSKALELSNINKTTKDPDGGTILSDNNGNPNGLLLDNAMELVRDNIPPRSSELTKKYILDACNECKRNGIVEVHDMDVHLEDLPAYKELDADNLLPIRLVQYIRGFDDEYKQHQPKPFHGNNLIIKGLKFYADGALGSRGALMIKNYNDKKTKGLELISVNDLATKAEEGCKAGWDISVHAIGDKANRNVLDAFEILRDKGYDNILRIEHSQLINENDLNRFEELDVYASVQPIHCTSDKKMALLRLGENYKFPYPWKSLIKNGAKLIAGSDFPIESHNPFLGIDSFVNRIPFGESNTWQPEETISIEQSLDAYCNEPHNASGVGAGRHGLKEGNYAHLCIVNHDFSDVKQIKTTQVLATIVNGKLTNY